MNCTTCGAGLVPLFITWVCPNQCDKQRSPSIRSTALKNLTERFSKFKERYERVGAVWLHPEDWAVLCSTEFDGVVTKTGESRFELWGAILKPTPAIGRGFCLLVADTSTDALAGDLICTS